jgi:YidC/Oxa1 family membrane protein insertase
MEKRVIIAVALCVGFLVLWTKLFPGPHPAPPPAPAAAPAGAAASGPSGTTPAGTAVGAGPAGAPGASAGGAAPAGNRPERQVELVTPDVRFVLSNRGGTLVHALLRDPKFRDHTDDPSTGHDLVRTLDPRDAPLRTTFPDSEFPTPADTAWDVSQPAPDAVVFAADAGGVHIEKRYRADTTRYRLHLEVVVSNRDAKAGEKSGDHHLTLAVTGRQDPDKRGGGFLSGPASNPGSALCEVNDKTEREPIEKLAKSPIENKTGAVRWIAMDEKFFLLAAVPYPDNPPMDRSCAATALPGEAGGQVTLRFGGRSPAPGTATSYAFSIFAGPKFRDDLEQVRPGGEDAKLDQAVDVTLSQLSRPILWLLQFFHRFTHNWGLAIVLLTLFIKLVTFYPTQKSLLSAKKMQRLAPKLNAIRKKYENDKQRQSVETMNLYKAHGVSPFGGCLPSLIQMPIWIALYSTLNYAVELYRAPFFGHIHDLTAKDPYYVTPLVMGGLMFLQMKMSPSGADSQQQAMMSVMMPIMFTGFSLFLPSGLAVYMLTSYLMGILQQLYINYLDRKNTAA